MSKNAQRLLKFSIEKLHSTLPSPPPIQSNEQNIEEKEDKVMEAFDTHFTTLEDEANLRVKVVHYANLFNLVCGYIRNDITILDQCINKLRNCSTEGNDLSTKCVLAHKYSQDISKNIKHKTDELEKVVDEMKDPKENIFEIKQKISKFNDELRILELSREES